MDFVAFVLLNAVLFIRPMEFIPALYGIPLYSLAFCLCILPSLPALLGKGVLRSAVGHPISVCVVTVAVTAVLSNLAPGRMEDSATTFDDLGKVVMYFILLVVIVRTPARMKWFLASLVIDGCLVAAVGVADYKGFIKVPSLVMIEEIKFVDGQMFPFRRLSSTGLFGDPNDLGLLLVGCIINSLYLATDRSVALPLRALWLLIPLPILFQALLLTYSRAGMLTLLIALAIYGIARYGRRGMVPIVLALPAILSVRSRQMEFSLSAASGQTRVAMWDLYVGLFAQNPLLGVGYNHCMDYAAQVAHNSYIHAYVELGYLGGTAFLGAILLSLCVLLRIKALWGRGLNRELSRLWPFLFASVFSYAVGIMSLSRCYVVPTFTILGLVVAYERMALSASTLGPLRWGPKLIGLLLVTSVAFLIGMFIIIKKSANYY